MVRGLEVGGLGGIGAIGPGVQVTSSGNPLQEQAQDSLLRAGGRQVNEDLPPGLDDAGSEFQQAQPQGIELHDTPVERRGISRRIDHNSQ